MIDIVDSLGETRWLMPPEFMTVDQRRYRVFGDGQAKLIPRDQWRSTNYAPLYPWVRDQDGIGSCNAEATVSCTEHARVLSGLPFVKLSSAYLYGKINGGSDRGSLLEDAIEEITKNGTCRFETVGPHDWRSRPSNAAAEAKQFRVLEWWWCPTFEHVVSAILRGYAVNIGMMWGDNDKPNADGNLPDRVSGRAGGHAFMMCDVHVENRVRLWGPNSWSKRWGVNGWFGVTEQRIKNEQGNFGWFAVRNTTVANTDPTVPAVTL